MADESLVMETYEAERRPVAKQTIEQATAHYIHRTAPELHHLIQDHNIHEVEPDVDLELAYRYHSTALYTQEGDSITEHIRGAVVRSGSIAHHVLVDTQTMKGVPLADYLGQGFVLFVRHEDIYWGPAMERVCADNADTPKVRVQHLVYELDSLYTARYGVGLAGAVLVRPDGIVAWSSSVGPEDATTAQKTLDEVFRKVVGRKS